jgi:TRAP-type mannitol/chloroaromatic compound transport system permease small subunit
MAMTAPDGWRKLEQLLAVLGRAAAWLMLLLVVMTFLVAVLRKGWSLSPVALQDAVIYLHAIALAFGFAYTLQIDGHVRVDVFYQRFSPRAKARTNVLGSLLLLLPSCAAIFWTSLPYVAASWRSLEGSLDAGGLPGLFLIKSLIPLFAVLLAVQGLLTVVVQWRAMSLGGKA